MTQTTDFMDLVEQYRLTARQEKNPETSADLIGEEYSEWLTECEKKLNWGWINPPKYYPTKELKELADLVYVIFGYANSRGWDLTKAVNRVHDNNMVRMFQPDGTIKYREDGKVMKNKECPNVDLSDLV